MVYKKILQKMAFMSVLTVLAFGFLNQMKAPQLTENKSTNGLWKGKDKNYHLNAKAPGTSHSKSMLPGDPSVDHPFLFRSSRGICCKATGKGVYLTELSKGLFLAWEKCIQKTWLRKSPIAILFPLFKYWGFFAILNRNKCHFYML